MRVQPLLPNSKRRYGQCILQPKNSGMIQDAAEAAAQFLNAYHARQFVESSRDQNLIDELMFACRKSSSASPRSMPTWMSAKRQRTTKAILTQNSGTASTRGCDMETMPRRLQARCRLRRRRCALL